MTSLEQKMLIKEDLSTLPDSDGDLVMEWNIDVNGDSFNEAIFMAGFSRIFTALQESKEPILKLRYS